MPFDEHKRIRCRGNCCVFLRTDFGKMRGTIRPDDRLADNLELKLLHRFIPIGQVFSNRFERRRNIVLRPENNGGARSFCNENDVKLLRFVVFEDDSLMEGIHVIC